MDLDPTLTASELRREVHNDSGAKKKLESRLHLHSSNVPGTSSYWTSKRFKFRSITFFQSYVHENEVALFNTLSLAEFHEPHLRLIISNYVGAIGQHTFSQNIITDDEAFSTAIQRYKQVVTHYHQAKTEVWYALVMKETYNMDSVIYANENASSCGAIHSHGLNYVKKNDPTHVAINSILSTLAFELFKTFLRLDNFIYIEYKKYLHNKVVFPCCPTTLTSNADGYLVRNNFCNNTGVFGKERFKVFEKTINTLQQEADTNLGVIFQSQYGLSAMHPGIFPKDWVQPGGAASHGYRTETNNMTKYSVVLEKRELWQFKCSREMEMPQRCSNYINHCGTHKCSNYCL